MTLNTYPWKQYHQFKKNANAGSIGLNGHSFRMALLNNTYTINLANVAYSDVSGSELGTANGYTAGGLDLGTGSYGGASSTNAVASGFFSVPHNSLISWTASGGSLTAMYAVIYDNTDAITPKGLVAVTALNSVNGIPQDVTIPSGQSLVITLSNPQGVNSFTLK